MRPKTEWYPIKVPAIIEDKDLFIRAGLQLKKNFETLGRNKVNEYLLAGMIWCVCGGRRAGEGVQKGRHLYYRCTNRVHTFPFSATCKEAGINARIADDAVWERIKTIMSSPKLLLEQIEIWKNNRGGSLSHDLIFDKDFAKREIAKLQAQEDRLAKAYSQEVFSLEKFEEYTKPLREKIRMFEDQINKANLEKTPENNIVLPDKDEIKLFAKEASQKLEDLNFKTKQAIIREVINKVLAGTNDIQVYGLINLNEISPYFDKNSEKFNYTANNINKNHVVLRSEHRNRWVAKRGEVHAF